MKLSTPTDVVIGSYTDGKEAPSVFHFKAAEHKAEAVLSEINPSFILKHDGYYYLVSEQKDGVILVLDPTFKMISRVKSMGDDPCHLSIDHTGTYLVATNYTSGTTVICKLTDHIPTIIHSYITHQGSSNNPDRQASPHPHSTVWAQNGKILFLADLGTDWVHYYAFTAEKITWQKQKSIKIQNSGPRTLSHGKEGSNLLYLSCELDNTVRVLNYQNGLQQLVAYKVSFNQTNFLSEIKYFNNQVFLGFRGDDKIMIFDVKEDKLEQICSFKVGAWPRHFAISPQNFLFVACQKGNLIQKYQVSSDKILLMSEMEITTPSVVVIL